MVDPWQPKRTKRSAASGSPYKYVLDTPVPTKGISDAIKGIAGTVKKRKKMTSPPIASSRILRSASKRNPIQTDVTPPRPPPIKELENSDSIMVVLSQSHTLQLLQVGGARSPSDYSELDQCLLIYTDIYEDVVSNGNFKPSVKKCLNAFHKSTQLEWVDKIRQAYFLLAVYKRLAHEEKKRKKLLTLIKQRLGN